MIKIETMNIVKLEELWFSDELSVILWSTFQVFFKCIFYYFHGSQIACQKSLEKLVN